MTKVNFVKISVIPLLFVAVTGSSIPSIPCSTSKLLTVMSQVGGEGGGIDHIKVERKTLLVPTSHPCDAQDLIVFQNFLRYVTALASLPLEESALAEAVEASACVFADRSLCVAERNEETDFYSSREMTFWSPHTGKLVRIELFWEQ